MPTTPRFHDSLARTIPRGGMPDAICGASCASASSKMRLSSFLRLVFSSSRRATISCARARFAVVSSSTASSGCPMRPQALSRGATRKAICSESTGSATRDDASSSSSPAIPVRWASVSPRATMMRFSPRSGTTSATEPIAARGSSESSRSESTFGSRSEPHQRSASAHASFHATPAPQRSPNFCSPGSRGCTTARATGTSCDG